MTRIERIHEQELFWCAAMDSTRRTLEEQLPVHPLHPPHAIRPSVLDARYRAPTPFARRSVVPIALFLAAIACRGGAESSSRADSAATQRDTSVATPAAGLAVTEHGLGPLRAGMTIAEAVTALGGALVVPVEYDTTGCDYATWRGGPRGVHVMIDEGRIARVEVDSVGVATAAGARVGDTEERIQKLYPGRVTVTPHKYEDGRYLTVNGVGDSSVAIVFETSKGRVTRYRAGRRPAVEYVEGCS